MFDSSTKNAWTDERVEKLKKLWNEGRSGANIADMLGGVTRNAVIGKAHRLGMSHRLDRYGVNRPPPSTKTRARQEPRRRLTILKAPFNPPPADFAPTEPLPVPMDELFIAPENRKRLLDLEPKDCRWPIGDPRAADFHFCGHAKHDPLPYCEFHARKSVMDYREYQPTEFHHYPIAKGSKKLRAA